MKFWKRKPPFLLMLTLALLFLLPILAILQYRWMGQVSEGERERLQKNLREGADKFAADFDRELARIFINFQSLAFDKEKAGDAYVACLTRWAQEATYPQLIKDVYVVKIDDKDPGREPLLEKLNTGTRQFEKSIWSDNLADLKKRFELQSQNSHVPEKIRGIMPHLPKMPENDGNILQILRNDIDPIDENIPALIIHRMPVRTEKDFTVFPFHLFTYTIVTLNLDYIRQEVIPQLATKYFSGNNGLDYNLKIVNRNNPSDIVYQSIVYPSDALDVPQNSQSDSAVNFFDVRLNEMNAVVREKAAQVVEEERQVRPKTGRIAIQVYRSETTNLPGSAPTLMVDAATKKFESRELQTGGWQLLLNHHAGSLGAVVASARRKNLAISFGILLLMALSIAMILISTRRAKRLAQQQIEFVAGVSHELRTPLAVIRSAGENLADGVIDESAQVKRYGQLIASEGRRLTEMVEQILEFSGIQSGRKNYELRLVALAEVIENAINTCRHLIEEGDFEIRKEITDDLSVISADEAALSRSIQNLLTNAMKYSGDNRVIDIEVKNLKSNKASEILITISDRGLGIAADELPHIFEPFYRGREATAAQIHGNGLGLSLVKNIVEAHNGKVSVSSIQGKGSAFTIHLPLAKNAEQAQGVEVELAT
jgi:two-component system, OmpR family, sensor histidine kinase SenX3